MSRRTLGAAAVLLCLATGSAFAERPWVGYSTTVDAKAGDVTPEGLIPYNKIFLNRCASGCTVRPGQANSINDTWGINSQRVLTKFPYDDNVWKATVSCMKDVFAPYGVEITDVDPGSAKHFEIMIAGRPTDLGMSSGIGGISPFNCSTYIDNSLVFDFAAVWASGGSGSSLTCDQGCIEETCATAAQEIAHSFALDHTIVAADPLTYFGYNGRRYFQTTGEQCGSDCVNGRAPNGATCTGSTQNPQSHACACTGQNTQNPNTTLLGLFGKGTPTPPSVTITRPKTGESVQPGFPVAAMIIDDNTVNHAELWIDNTMIQSINSTPYAFNAPAALADGTHKVEVRAFDRLMTQGTGTVSVIIGKPCTKPADCPLETDTCVGGRCVPGSGVQGGLGTGCTDNGMCASGQCASDGTDQLCVEPCTPGGSECPSGYSCIETGAEMGVCWPGGDSGGCAAGGSGGPVLLGLVFGALLVSRRRS
jgi:hypothetical protein